MVGLCSSNVLVKIINKKGWLTLFAFFVSSKVYKTFAKFQLYEHTLLREVFVVNFIPLSQETQNYK